MRSPLKKGTAVWLISGERGINRGRKGITVSDEFQNYVNVQFEDHPRVEAFHIYSLSLKADFN